MAALRQKVKLCRLLGKATFSALWFTIRPKVKFCRPLGRATFSEIWSKLRLRPRLLSSGLLPLPPRRWLNVTLLRGGHLLLLLLRRRLALLPHAKTPEA